MAGFRTHITTSTFLGAGYGAIGHLYFEMPLETSLLAAGLCSVSGMLPDLDSDSGVPLRESLAFGSSVVPMLMLERFAELGLSHEGMVLAGAGVYLAVRFGFGWFLKKYTVHRGMFHSLPAVLIAGLVAFLICQCHDLHARYYKAAAVMLGYLSHLVLDELWSIDLARLRTKRSFGTALKIYSRDLWGDLSTYAKLVALTYLAIQDPIWMEQFRMQPFHDPAPANAPPVAEHEDVLLERLRR